MAKVRRVNVKPKNVKPKSGIRNRIAKGVGTAAIAGVVTFGAMSIKNPIRRVHQSVANERAIEQIIKTKKINVNAKTKSRNPNLIRETVNSYNRKAKTGQVYFYDGKKINSVNFDQTGLKQIRQILPDAEKAKIDSLIARKVARVEATAKSNVVLSKKIIDRVGKLDYAKYLLSLTPSEFSRAFSGAEIKVVRQALERSNPQIFKNIKSQQNAHTRHKVIYSMILGLLWGGIISPNIAEIKVTRKRNKTLNSNNT
ncbi:MAG TPA: hypothetical protein PK655_03430 [archaeon]|nr:hypothetical protein [archaeon]HPV66475.1 hypothetical protein [archaeon]